MNRYRIRLEQIYVETSKSSLSTTSPDTECTVRITEIH